MPVTPSAPEALAAAIAAKEASTVAAVLARFPELERRLDEPLPNEAFGATPLLKAVYQDDRETVDVLLRAGANINQRSHWWAGSFGVLDHDGRLADYLIERGATVDIWAAARLGRIERLEELLAADASLVHARGGDGQTPLHFARDTRIADLLLQRGARIDARDVDHESTPAQWMIKDRQEVVRFLVDRGCTTDILMASALGDTALVERHLAADPDAVLMTVSERYFPKQDPRSGGTIYIWTLGSDKGPHVIARDFGHEDVFALLMDRSPIEVQLAVWCEAGDEERVHELLTRDPAISGRIPAAAHRKLPDAAREQNDKAVRLLLRAGWPVDARGQHGATALHWAAWNGMPDLASELLRHGAPLEVKDNDYDGTPVQWAMYASENGWPCSPGDYDGVVRVLIDAGARRP